MCPPNFLKVILYESKIKVKYVNLQSCRFQYGKYSDSTIIERQVLIIVRTFRTKNTIQKKPDYPLINRLIISYY